MAVTEQTPLNTYTANGATTVFAFSFLALQSADLTVQVIDVNGVTTTKTLGVDYTVAGLNVTAGGTVTFTVAPASGSKVVVFRDSQLARATDYQDNGDLLSDSVNLDFDRLWLALQEGYSVIGQRSVRGPVGETLTELPVAATRANYLLGFDSLGNPVAVVPTSGSAAALATDLTSSVTPSKGAGQIGFGYGLAYAAGTIGKWLQDLITSAGSTFIGWVQAGSGAVLRTIQSKLRESVSVKDFGAVGDGVADDTAAINAALAEVQISGATILFTPGTYLYSGTVSAFFGMHLKGSGWQTTTLKFTNLAAIAIDFTLANVSDVSIIGFTLDGTNKATRTERCIRIHGTEVSSFFMDEVRFTNWASPVNSAVIHVTSTAKLFASEWGTLRFASGSYNGSAIRDDGGGPCLKINNLYTGNADGSIDYVIGVVGSNLKIGVWNVGGATGVLMQHRGTSLSSLDIDLINYETSASPAHVLYLADTQFRLGALALAGAGQPVYGVSIQETGIGDKYIGPVHGSKAATATGHVQINTIAAPTGQIYYAGSATNVVNSIAGSPQLPTVFALRENKPVSHQYAVAEGRLTTTDATSSGILSYPLPVGATANVTVYISGVQSDGSNRASYIRRVTVYRLGSANAALQGAVVDGYTSESNAAWDVAVDVTASNVRARVIGVAATTIKWNARMEVSYVLESN